MRLRKSPEAAPALTSVERAAQYNLGLTAHSERMGMNSFLLVNTETAELEHNLEAPCDAINREMLTNVYARVGIDPSKPSNVLDESTGTRTAIFVSYETPDRQTIVESFNQEGNWTNFSVKIYGRD